MRRLLLPSFHGDAVLAHTELIGALTATEIERWPVGEPFAVHPRMQAITLEAILHAVIGVRDERRLARLRTLLPRVAGANLFAFWAEGAMPRLAENQLGSRLPWIAARREADRLLYEEIAAHRDEPDGREDILALLIAAGGEDGAALGDEELRDQVMTLLVAGHETTSATLAWCFERLLRHPRCLERLQEEIAHDAGDAYLDAVVNETLRTRPVIDQAVRTLTGPTEIGGYLLPTGTTVAASILGVQRSEAYEHPEEFRPERFLEGAPPPYALIPFGGGVRRCVGASFAVMEIKAILRRTIAGVRLRPSGQRPERPVRWRRFTVTPGRGGRVTVERKLSP
jgi:cytochrome P450 family 135